MKASTLSFYRPHKRVQYTGELINHKTGQVFTPERRVKQSFVAECDINTILKQYSQTGQIRHMSAKAAMGAYQDLPDELDFQQALNTVKAAEVAFATLPAHVRDRFGNDPAHFLEFASDPRNGDDLVKMGLATKRPELEPPLSGPPKEAPKPPQAPTAAPAAPKPPEGS